MTIAIGRRQMPALLGGLGLAGTAQAQSTWRNARSSSS